MGQIIQFKPPDKVYTPATRDLMARVEKLKDDARELVAYADKMTDEEYNALPPAIFNAMEYLYISMRSDPEEAPKRVTLRDWFNRLKQEDRDALYGCGVLVTVGAAIYWFFF